MTQDEASQLLTLSAGGDRVAFNRLYQAESPKLLGIVLKIVRNRSVAEDILHDAFIRIWSHAERFDPALGDARGWMASIARNLALNAVRYQGREVLIPATESDTPLHTAFEPLTLEQLDADHDSAPDADDCRRLHDCLQRIEPERRSAIIHAYVHGMSHPELAAWMDTPLGTVKAWIKRSLTRLRECMA